jgi:hypothetical protein
MKSSSFTIVRWIGLLILIDIGIGIALIFPGPLFEGTVWKIYLFTLSTWFLWGFVSIFCFENLK